MTSGQRDDGGSDRRAGAETAATARHARVRLGACSAASLALCRRPLSRQAPQRANTSIYQKNITSKLNSTGRTINMPVPFKDEAQALGDIVVRSTRTIRCSCPRRRSSTS